MINTTDALFSLHHIETGSVIHVFETCAPKRICPKGVAFGEEGAVVVCGSDNGTVYIFETSLGCKLQEIPHSRGGGMSQTVAVSGSSCCYVSLLSLWWQTVDIDSNTFIACASSDDHDGVYISIWKRAAYCDEPRNVRRAMWGSISMLAFAATVFICIATAQMLGQVRSSTFCVKQGSPL